MKANLAREGFQKHLPSQRAVGIDNFLKKMLRGTMSKYRKLMFKLSLGVFNFWQRLARCCRINMKVRGVETTGLSIGKQLVRLEQKVKRTKNKKNWS